MEADRRQVVETSIRAIVVLVLYRARGSVLAFDHIVSPVVSLFPPPLYRADDSPSY